MQNPTFTRHKIMSCRTPTNPLSDTSENDWHVTPNYNMGFAPSPEIVILPAVLLFT
jgi:hypothetical protein